MIKFGNTLNIKKTNTILRNLQDKIRKGKGISKLAASAATNRQTNIRKKMTSMFNKISLRHLLWTNLLIILTFVFINSQTCDYGFACGQMVKEKDNFMFLIQLALNVAFSIIYLIKADDIKWGMLILNLVFTALIYFVIAVYISITKAGLFG